MGLCRQIRVNFLVLLHCQASQSFTCCGHPNGGGAWTFSTTPPLLSAIEGSFSFVEGSMSLGDCYKIYVGLGTWFYEHFGLELYVFERAAWLHFSILLLCCLLHLRLELLAK